jgi:O-antigen/teichoic acid export membrane protein
MSRNCGVEFVGEYNYHMSIITIVTSIITFGTGQSMLSHFKNCENLAIYTMNIKLFTLIAIVIIPFIFLIKSFTNVLEIPLVLLLLIVINSLFLAYISIFKNAKIIEGKIYLYYLYDIVLYIAIIVLLLLKKNKTVNINTIGMLLIAISVNLLFAYLPAFHKLHIKSIVESKINVSYLINSAKSFIAALVFILSYRSNVFIVEHNFSLEILGYFTLGITIIDAFINSISSSMLPDLRKMIEINKGYLLKYIAKYCVITLLSICIIIIIGPFIVSKIFKVDEGAIRTTIYILSIAVPSICTMRIFSNIFIMNKLLNYYLLSSIIFLGSIIICNLIQKGGYELFLINYVIATYIGLLASLMLFIYYKMKLQKKNAIGK